MPEDSAVSSKTMLSNSISLKQHGDNKFKGEIEPQFLHNAGVYGGFLVSILLTAAKIHFSTTLSHLKQNQTSTIHVEFLGAVDGSTITIEVENTKIGRRTSTIHLKLIQRDRVRLVAYAINIVASQAGAETTADHTVHHFAGLDPPPPGASLSLLERDADDRWFAAPPITDVRVPMKCWNLVRNYFPSPAVGGTSAKEVSETTVVDQWLTPALPKDVFTTPLIGFLTDLPPAPYENTLHYSPFSAAGSAARTKRFGNPEKELTPGPIFSYPTLSLTLDIVRELPPEGVRWLFVRNGALEIRQGSMSITTTVLGERGQLVARAAQKALVINTSKL